MLTVSMPAPRRKRSALRCVALPMPTEAELSEPGFAFAGHACACASTCRAQSASAAIDLLSFPDILASRCLSDGTIWGKRNCDAPFRPTQRGGEYDGDPDDGGERW